MEKQIALLAELGREAASLSRKLVVAPERLAGCRGSDDTGTVTVELNGAGLVTKVEVREGWRRRLPAHQVGPAILAAVEAAAERRLERWAAEVTENHEAPESPFVVPAVEPATPDAIQAIFGLIEQAEKETAGVVDLHTRATRGASPGGHVTVTLTGKQLTAVDVDGQWLRLANHTDLATAAHAAIRAAYRVAREHADGVLTGSAAVRLKQLTVDPRG